MNKKALKTTVASLALVGVIGVGATLAYLSSQSNKLTNTFTAGEGYPEIPEYNQALILHESFVPKTDEPDEPTDCTKANSCYLVDGTTKRNIVGNDYEDVQAGSVVTKDPEVTLNANSVNSYLYIKVQGLDALKGNNVTTQINDKAWVKVSDEEGLDGLYRYEGDNATKGIVETSTSTTTTEPLFKTLTFAGDEDYSKVTLDNVNLAAAAVQATYTQDGVEVIVPTDGQDGADAQAAELLANAFNQ
ncbi:SipW-dependent-type signal peptide-containing protein [Erysipelotrichaceae bacterium HCN-30851]